MDFSGWITLMDAAIKHIQREAETKKTLERMLVAKDQELAAKNELILSLQEQLATASTAMFANESELSQLHDKFTQLSSMVLPTDT